MKGALPKLLTLLLLSTFCFSSIAALAQSPPQQPPEIQTAEAEDDAPVQRVARLSFIQGDVSFLRAGTTEWAEAAENLPVLAGDQVYAGRGGRAELQLGRASYIRLSENTAMTVTELSDEAAQFEITEGIAIIRVDAVAPASQRFEVDTPNAALVLREGGLYRVNVRGDNDSEVIARRGSIEVSTDDGNFKVREGHKLVVDTSPGGRLEIAIDTSRDDWDQWSYDRDTAIDNRARSAAPDDVALYETAYNGFYGVSDLSGYGTWTDHSSYGRCWIPRVGSDWAPYRQGQWLWIPAVGWSWLASEPWGWAPYHYGRWDYIIGLGWAWIPGIGRYSASYYRWRPALVAFFNWRSSRDHYIGWYPLAPGERWRRDDWRRGRSDHAHLQYPSPRDGSRRPDDGKFRIGIPRKSQAVTVMPVEGFARPDRSRVRPTAPGGDASGWLGKDIRPGLPEMTPAPAASAPGWHRGGEQAGSRRVVVPPNEIIKRPVVTRHRPADSQVGVSVPRERRLILPRKPETPSDAFERKRGENRGEDEASSERKRRRKEERGKEEASAGQRPPDNSQGNDNAGDSGNHRRRRPDSPPKPEAGEGKSARDGAREDQDREKQDREGREREKRERENRDRQRRDDEERHRAKRPDAAEHSRPREDARPARIEPAEPRRERPQPPPESRSQDRQERQQQKEERRQERREERKKN